MAKPSRIQVWFNSPFTPSATIWQRLIGFLLSMVGFPSFAFRMGVLYGRMPENGDFRAYFWQEEVMRYLPYYIAGLVLLIIYALAMAMRVRDEAQKEKEQRKEWREFMKMVGGMNTKLDTLISRDRGNRSRR
jgi:hypothetical protein